MRKLAFLSVLVTVFISSFAGAADSIVFGVDPTKPPMQYVDGNGDITGFEIDLIKEVSHRLGVVPIFKRVSWEGIFEGLKLGQYDAACACVSINEQRAQDMDFTVPYYRVVQAILAHTEKGMKSIKDLKGRKVGVKKETTSLEALKSISGVIPLEFNNVPDAVKALLAGEVDAVICDGPLAGYYAVREEKQGLGISFVIENDNPEYYGIALKKGNEALLRRLNKAITLIKSHNKDIDLQKKWFSALLSQ